jgi:hypothetical protein
LEAAVEDQQTSPLRSHGNYFSDKIVSENKTSNIKNLLNTENTINQMRYSSPTKYSPLLNYPSTN